ncbi:MAG TPA: HD domain-containing protein [Longimicrobiales bacterium]|nr:HD domain-containing protein [Longimicrobiales bacterium]
MSRFETEHVGDHPADPTVEGRFADRIEMRVPDRHNPKLHAVLERVNADDELYGLWLASNVTAIERLGMTDHGPVHVKIVTNIAVRMLRLLIDAGVRPSVVETYRMDPTDAEIVVAMGALLHDIGMSIHRDEHESFSLFIARRKLVDLLDGIYTPRERVFMESEILHAITSHRAGGRPLTVEAGVVRIADALDMAKGRSRIPFEAGSLSIHSVSAAAIEAVRIEPGETRPIKLCIEMTNSAGVFQLDQLFRGKLRGSGLEEYIEVEAELEGETEKRLVRNFSF